MTISKRKITQIRTVAAKLEKVQPQFDYYEFIEMHYHVDSTLDLSLEQAEDAIQAMDRELKAIERAKKPKRKKGFLTNGQKEYIEGMFEELGWDSVNRQVGFINKQIGRRCTVDMLRNREASKVISGLEKLVVGGYSDRQKAKGKTQKGAK